MHWGFGYFGVFWFAYLNSARSVSGARNLEKGKQMLIGYENFFHSLIGERSCWIKGQLGSYKTALAYRLAYELLSNSKYGYRHLVSNIPDVWSSRIEDVDIRYEKAIREDRLQPYADSVIILDEGGLFIRYADQVDEIFAGLRKLNVVILVPSKKEPHRTIRQLRVYKKYDLHNFGIDGIVYGWKLKGDEEDLIGSFVWLGCSEIYGVYDTDYFAVDSEGVDEWMVDLKNKLTGGRYGRSQASGKIAVSAMASPGWEDGAGDLEEIIDELGKERRAFSILKKRK